ncbi:OmpH family outer membrane protein, partial [bacterium]|nr:OmpH family outer membrane protein [bacterium]
RLLPISVLFFVVSIIFFCGGCQQRGLHVGTVNAEKIISEDPKYMELRVVLSDERQKLYSQIPKNVNSMSNTQKKALQEKLAKDAAERSDKFNKLYRESMAKLQEDIKSHASEVAKDKGLDIVVVNTMMNYPVVLYSSGDNITLDILLKMGNN